MKTTQKEIKGANAKDITRLSFEEIENLRKEQKYFITIATSYGVYGINGAIIQGYSSKKLYKIIGRTSSLFQII